MTRRRRSHSLPRPEVAAFILGERAKVQADFPSIIGKIREQFGVIPAPVGFLEEDALVELLQRRIREWQHANSDCSNALHRVCALAAHRTVGSAAECAAFIRNCVFAEPYWFVTLEPWPAILPVPCVDDSQGELYRLRRMNAYLEEKVEQWLSTSPFTEREAYFEERATIAAEAESEAAYLRRVVVEIGRHVSLDLFRSVLLSGDRIAEELTAALREALGPSEAWSLPHYRGCVEQNFRWFRRWKAGMPIAKILDGLAVDRSHVSRVVHTIDRLLRDGN